MDADACVPLAVVLMSLLFQICGLMLVVLGAMTVPLPVPTGFVLMVLGLSLLLSSSPTVLRAVRRYRRTSPKFDDVLKKARLKLPIAMGKPLRRSEPWRFKPRPPGP